MISVWSLEILKAKTGFRYDSLYGNGITDFNKVIQYEVFELKNKDILYTCKDIYMLDLDLRKTKGSVAKVLNYFYRMFGTKELYCIWLGSLETIAKVYKGKPGIISKYSFDNSVLIAADLGFEGVLLVSDKEFLTLGMAK